MCLFLPIIPILKKVAGGSIGQGCLGLHREFEASPASLRLCLNKMKQNKTTFVIFGLFFGIFLLYFDFILPCCLEIKFLCFRNSD